MFAKAGAFLINLGLVSHVEIRDSSLLLHFIGPADESGRPLELTGRNRDTLLNVLASNDERLGRMES